MGQNVVPIADQPFFAASMGAAAALLGLLFVAVSVAPENTVGAGAPVERQTVAESVFTALVAAFFISMAGTMPDMSLGGVALVLGGFALVQTVRATRRVWPQPFTFRVAAQRLALVAIAFVIYAAQLRVAFQLLQAPSSPAAVDNAMDLLFAIYAFALGRSWELLGARRGRLSRLVGSTLLEGTKDSVATPTRTTPELPNEVPKVVGDG